LEEGVLDHTDQSGKVYETGKYVVGKKEEPGHKCRKTENKATVKYKAGV